MKRVKQSEPRITVYQEHYQITQFYIGQSESSRVPASQNQTIQIGQFGIGQFADISTLDMQHSMSRFRDKPSRCYEYRDRQKLQPMVGEISSAKNLVIMALYGDRKPILQIASAKSNTGKKSQTKSGQLPRFIESHLFAEKPLSLRSQSHDAHCDFFIQPKLQPLVADISLTKNKLSMALDHPDAYRVELPRSRSHCQTFKPLE